MPTYYEQIAPYRNFSPSELAAKESAYGSNHELVDLTLGLAGEVGEVIDAEITGNRDAVIDECGDVLNYAFNLWAYLGFEEDFSEDIYEVANHCGANEAPLTEMVIDAAAITGYVRKHLGYGKPLNVGAIETSLQQIVASVQTTLLNFDSTLAIAQRGNVDKIKARYPQGYTNAAAIAQVDKEGQA